jgi:hypothetical protein
MTLPINPSDFVNAVTKSREQLSNETTSGGNYIKLDKAGRWVSGKEEVELEPGALWAINPAALYLGFVAWADGTKLGEEMRLVTQPLLQRHELPDVGAQWNAQMGMQLVCLTGEDEGEQVQYVNSSKGAMSAFEAVLDAILARARKGETELVPLVRLGVDSYRHKKYGRVFVPVINIDQWAGADGVLPSPEAKPDPTPEAKPDPTPEEPPRRRRRRAA